MHAVCSIEAGTGGEWQAALLAYSWRKVGETDPLTVLCAGGAPAQEIDAEVIVTGNYRHAGGGDYAPLNKPFSITEWLMSHTPQDSTVCVLDADMVLFDRMPQWYVPHQHAIAQRHGSLAEVRDTLIRGATRNPRLLVPAGVPYWLHADDLGELAPMWAATTIRLRQHSLVVNRWQAEMYGYIVAAADLGITHELVLIDCGAPLYHYFGGLGNCGWAAGKELYRPWEQKPQPAPGAPEVAHRFTALLNEFAASRGVAAAAVL